MAQETQTGLGFEAGNVWFGAAVGGLLGAAVFGAMMHAMMTDVIVMMIPAMYGLAPGATTGWAIHLVHGVIFGLVYAALVTPAAVRQYAGRPTTGLGVGAVYGLLVWVVAAAVIMPIWLGMPEMVPDLNPMSAIGHVVFGAVLGALTPIVAELSQ